MMFDYSTPMGSPLGPLGAPPNLQPPLSSTARMAPTISAPTLDSPTPALSPTAMISNLPKPPPRKGPSIWDRDHISETLASIGAGFFASQNFGDGLGATAQIIAGRSKQLRDEQRPDLTYGGPGDQFEIATDRHTGARTIREVPEFRAATDRAAAARNAPDFKTTADRRSRAMFAIATQVPPEQRAAAYRDLMENPEHYQVDTSGLPAEWDDTYGTLAGTMGLTVDQGLSQRRSDANLEDMMRHRTVTESQRDHSLQQGDVRAAQGNQLTAAKVAKLRTPPASARKPKISSANSDLSYLLK